jgi:DNA-binding phage protein
MKAEMGTPVIATPYRSQEDATVESFAKDPEYAAYLNAVLEDGDAAELRVALMRIAGASSGLGTGALHRTAGGRKA